MLQKEFMPTRSLSLGMRALGGLQLSFLSPAAALQDAEKDLDVPSTLHPYTSGACFFVFLGLFIGVLLVSGFFDCFELPDPVLAGMVTAEYAAELS